MWRVDPADELSRPAATQGCDFIARPTHGNRCFTDQIDGSTITQVRHRATVPVLLVRG